MFELISLQNITAILILVVFFAGRISWSKIKGKRQKNEVSPHVVSGRFLIQILVGGLIPILAMLNVFDINTVLMITSNRCWLYILGTLLALFGLLLMFLARLHRQKDWGFMGDSAGEKLFTKGVYRVTRHPYYIGAILVGVGIYLILNSWLVLIMVPVSMFVKGVIATEDSYLLQKFGDAWVQYKNKTGVIPFL